MYRYSFTLNMPTRPRRDDSDEVVQNLVHQVIGDFDGDMDALLKEVNANPFIIIQEVFKEHGSHVVKNMGPLLINTLHLGKVKYFV